jgi:putative two-component system response regulator
MPAMGSAEAISPRILVVEDHATNAAMLEGLLSGQGYQVSRAADGLQALAHLAENPPDLIFLDLDLPRMNGFDVCHWVKQNPETRLIPIIIVTGQDPFEARMRAWDLGADEFISKPIQCMELLARCRSLLRLKRLTDELETAEAVMLAFAQMVEAKSPFTNQHSMRVSEMSVLLADHIGLCEQDRELLRKGALLHDIGKISIPDVILNKPGKLTTAEYDRIKEHTIEGYEIVKKLRSLKVILPLIRWHHERMDGQGYPDGLTGDQIPVLVRILAVADVYDSLASMRPYRAAIPLEACMNILRANAAGGGLDSVLVEQFDSALRLHQFGSPSSLHDTQTGARETIPESPIGLLNGMPTR